MLLPGGIAADRDGNFRQRIDKTLGFPADRKAEKERLAKLIGDLRQIAGLEEALAAVGDLPPVRYSDDEWRIVQRFLLLRHAAAELRVVFAESGTVDYHRGRADRAKGLNRRGRRAERGCNGYRRWNSSPARG